MAGSPPSFEPVVATLGANALIHGGEALRLLLLGHRRRALRGSEQRRRLRRPGASDPEFPYGLGPERFIFGPLSGPLSAAR